MGKIIDITSKLNKEFAEKLGGALEELEEFYDDVEIISAFIAVFEEAAGNKPELETENIKMAFEYLKKYMKVEVVDDK